MFGQKLFDEFLCAPFLSLEIAEKEGVCYIGFIGRVVVTVVEYRLELVNELFLAAHKFGESIYVVGHIECVVP